MGKLKLKKLSKNMLKVLWEKKALSREEITYIFRKNYSAFRQDEVYSSVDKQLLEMHERGEIYISSDDVVRLTKKGQEKYEQLLETQRKQRELRDRNNLTKQKAAKTKRVHDEIKEKMAEFGELLGKECENEYRLMPSVILDTVWYRSDTDTNSLSHAFEVQNNGDIKNAICNLYITRIHHPNCKLYLVINDEKDYIAVGQLLGPEIGESINVVLAKDILGCHDELTKARKKMSPSCYDAIQKAINILAS